MLFKVELPQYENNDKKKILKQHCTLFRTASILSGSSFHEILYSIIKTREIAEFIPNQLRFHEKNFS